MALVAKLEVLPMQHIVQSHIMERLLIKTSMLILEYENDPSQFSAEHNIMEVLLIDVLPKSIRNIYNESVKKPTQEPETDSNNNEDEGSDILCNECKGGDDAEGNHILLCDGNLGKCNSSYHMRCLNPPISAIPEGDWYCDSCVKAGINTTGKRKSAVSDKKASKKPATELVVQNVADYENLYNDYGYALGSCVQACTACVADENDILQGTLGDVIGYVEVRRGKVH